MSSNHVKRTGHVFHLLLVLSSVLLSIVPLSTATPPQIIVPVLYGVAAPFAKRLWRRRRREFWYTDIRSHGFQEIVSYCGNHETLNTPGPIPTTPKDTPQFHPALNSSRSLYKNHC